MNGEVPLDLALLQKLADDVVFGPQSGHQKIRHNALLALQKAYRGGYLARVKEEPCPQK